MTTQDLSAYINQAISGNYLEIPPRGNHQYDELCATLYREHQAGGAIGASTAWQRLQQAYPELQVILADPPIRSIRKLVHVSELVQLPVSAYLIVNELTEDSLAVLYGPSGSYKSFLALDYAVQVARTQRPVVYVAAEGKSGYHNRMKAAALYQQFNPDTLPIHFYFDGINLASPIEVQAFINTIQSELSCPPALIIIDTLARCMVGDENSSRDMGQFIVGCDVLRQQLHAAVMVVHHTGKRGQDERGSSALRGAADVMIGVHNHDGVIEVFCDKSKDAPEFETRYLRAEVIEVAPGENSCVLVPSTRSAKANPDRLTDNEQRILETLSLAIFKTHGASTRSIRESTGIAEATLYRVLSALKDAGLILQTKKYEPYFITDKGSALISPATPDALDSPDTLSESL